METFRGGLLFIVRWVVHYPLVFGTYRVRNWVRAPFMLRVDLQTKPGILVSNYGNYLYDNILGWMLGPVWPFTFVADSLHRVTILRPFLKFFRTLPYVRASDLRYPTEERKARNQKSLDDVAILLRKGHWFSVFPEPSIGDRATIQTPLRQGAAIVALKAEEESGWSLGLNIYVYGTNYENKLAGRSNLYIRWATPIAVSRFRDLYVKDQNTGVQALMAEVERALHSAVLEAESVAVLGDAHRLAYQRNETTFAGVQHALAEIKTGRAAPTSSKKIARGQDSTLYQLIGYLFWIFGGIMGWPFRVFGRLCAYDRSQEMTFQVGLWFLILLTGGIFSENRWVLLQLGTTWFAMRSWLWAWRRGILN